MNCPQCGSDNMTVSQRLHWTIADCPVCHYHSEGTTSPPAADGVLDRFLVVLRWRGASATPSELASFRKIFSGERPNMTLHEVASTLGREPEVRLGPYYRGRAESLMNSAREEGLAASMEADGSADE